MTQTLLDPRPTALSRIVDGSAAVSAGLEREEECDRLGQGSVVASAFQHFPGRPMGESIQGLGQRGGGRSFMRNVAQTSTNMVPYCINRGPRGVIKEPLRSGFHCKRSRDVPAARSWERKGTRKDLGSGIESKFRTGEKRQGRPTSDITIASE